MTIGLILHSQTSQRAYKIGDRIISKRVLLENYAKGIGTPKQVMSPEGPIVGIFKSPMPGNVPCAFLVPHQERESNSAFLVPFLGIDVFGTTKVLVIDSNTTFDLVRVIEMSTGPTIDLEENLFVLLRLLTETGVLPQAFTDFPKGTYRSALERSTASFEIVLEDTTAKRYVYLTSHPDPTVAAQVFLDIHDLPHNASRPKIISECGKLGGNIKLSVVELSLPWATMAVPVDGIPNEGGINGGKKVTSRSTVLEELLELPVIYFEQVPTDGKQTLSVCLGIKPVDTVHLLKRNNGTELKETYLEAGDRRFLVTTKPEAIFENVANMSRFNYKDRIGLARADKPPLWLVPLTPYQT